MSLVLAITVAALYSGGTYLLLQRRLTRIILGLTLLGHGAVLLLLVAGGGGDEPFTDQATTALGDPLVQALALTAVVITFAVTMFLLAMANRSWQLTHDDEVQDDVEDRRIALLEGDEDIDEFAALDELDDEEPATGGPAEVRP